MTTPTAPTPTNDLPTGYLLPPPDVVDIINAPQTPAAYLSPNRQTLLLLEYEVYPPIELLARPFLKLGGLRLDPVISARQRTNPGTSYTVVSVADGTRRKVTGLPDSSHIGAPYWAIDGVHFAFLRDADGGLEVWVGDTDSATCHRVPGLRVTDMLAYPLLWKDDCRSLLATILPTARGPMPPEPRVPTGPVIQETAGKQSKASTYQDLLQSPHDERLFEHFGTTQLVTVDIETGEQTPLGEPGMYVGASLSPDENYLVVTRLKSPARGECAFSYRVPYYYFAQTVEIWDSTGNHVHTIADLPVLDEVPQQGVPTGPRSEIWQALKPATLLYVEALDGGDPLAKVSHRDRVMRLSAPFVSEPEEVLRLTHRFAGWNWTAQEDAVLLGERDRDRRWRTTYRLNLQQPNEKSVLFDLSQNDAYNDPGAFIYTVTENGERVMLQDGDFAYLSGRGATPDGDRPFLDKIHLLTGEKTRLFVCDDTSYTTFLAFLDKDDRTRILISHQTPTQPANYFVHNLATGERHALTDFRDPHPQITGLRKELVRYTRADGVPLSGMLYLPPDYDPASGQTLPVLLWAYPEEYSDAGTAGQVRGSTNTFTYLAGTSPLWFVTQGFAVLNNATMPVVGDPETMNDTFIEQVVASAKAAIDELQRRGIADPQRILVAGHSYGAFMTAHLLAHAPGMFAAGIARSGAYNRTLTPFGFQSERRAFWDAVDTYIKLSPFTHAAKIKEPLLLIHGQADNNPGTYTVQSERFFQALQATGGTARLVLLPHESHGYRAKESVLHVLAEMFLWAEKYVKNRTP